MSISLERLRMLRRQAGDATAAPASRDASETAPAPAAPTATPLAGHPGTGERAPSVGRAADAVAAPRSGTPSASRSVFDWIDRPPAANSAPPGKPLQPHNAAALRRLLGARGRVPATAAAAAPAPTPAPVARRRTGLGRSLPGTEIAAGLHLIEAFLPQPVPAAPLSLAFAKRPEEHVAATDLLFFDTETTGLAGGTGTRAFMIGAADWVDDPDRGQGLRVRQLLMATMAAEAAMLRAFSGWLGAGTVLSSYNGRSYDAPLLKTRFRLSRQVEPISALDHVDLLHPTRRRYRGRWENCRLATVERQLLGVVREDDLPGSQAPAAWLGFLRGGDAHDLHRVAAHNHQDVVTLALLFQQLVRAQHEEAEALPEPLASA
ncbi:ribonuclease H-like domain-containing protein [Xanthomonas sp. XNM01]|uniref:ribonuclease H-like domain-containing protein n=1 Tax=Xanthomonas sp. XNM01 TaxID=2769289 RepID=UPI00177D3D29|nr:ribonuclease H-like domain-containing protein [Xanthomonas sp. XNM01]MBD9369071.1 ribonuclease H-like domain-containing protein [Xanthomonas sp. XNM01]